ncbi:MAG TPA: rhomboid family intramembrane serine protease [Blastocatellia bacterium]|nr:rhomboid family intramembrane serine protease [Blastocatellia bacterium]
MENEGLNLSEPRPFIVCASCGQLIPSQAPTCEYCGAVSPFGEQLGEQQFLHDLFSRPITITPILIGINVAIYLLMTYAAGGDIFRSLLTGVDRFTLLAFGAQNNELLQNGQWFRLITPAFVHIGLLHILLNSYVFWSVGPMVEKLYGSARFLAMYLLTAAGGSLASFLNHSWKHDSIGASAGASGAIFGLFGVIAVFSFRYRSELPPRFLQALKSGVLPAIAVNLMLGFSMKQVDNAAHIGGLLTGGLLALLIPYASERTDWRTSRTDKTILAVCLVTVLISFAFLYRQSKPLLNRQLNKVEFILNSIEAADSALVNVFRSADQKPDWKPSPQDLSQLSAAAESLEKGTAPDATIEKIRLDLIRLLQQQTQLINHPGSTPLSEQLDPLGEEFLRNRRAYTDWLKTDGPKYGFELNEKAKEQNKK